MYLSLTVYVCMYVQDVDLGPPPFLLVSLMDEEGLDIGERLLEVSALQPSLLYVEDEGASVAMVNGKDMNSEGASRAVVHPNLTASVGGVIDICVVFVSSGGIVYGHDVTQGQWLSSQQVQYAVLFCYAND